jgi:hypothetical protein
MGVNVIELPQGLQLPTGVNLDYEELASSVATDESEELWLPQEFPPELVREGKEKELTSMKDFWSLSLCSHRSDYTRRTKEGYSDSMGRDLER